MSDIERQLVFGLAGPALFALIFAIPGSGAAPGAARRRVAWRLPLGLGLTVVVAFLGLYGPPREQWQHVVFVPAAGLVVGLVMALTGRSRPWRGLLFAVLGAAAVGAMWPVLAREAVGWKIGPALAAVILFATLEPLAARRSGASVPVALALATAAAAAIVLLSGFMKLAVPVAALAVALGTTGVVALRRRNLSLADGALAVVVPLLVLAPVTAWLYMTSGGGTMPVACFALPLAAPALLWLGELPPVRDRAAWMATGIRWGLVTLACGAAIALALLPGGAAT